jgi:phenylalanyl-tRNA synthetase alpha chain
MVTYTQITSTAFVLTPEGLEIADKGSHEYRLWAALPPKGGEPIGVPELKVGGTTPLLRYSTTPLLHF